MHIKEVRKCGTGVEVLVDTHYFWFDLDTTAAEIKAVINTPHSFNTEKFNKLKDLEGTDI